MEFLRKIFGSSPIAAPASTPSEEVSVPPALAYREGPGGQLVPDHDYDFALYADRLEGQALHELLDRHVSPSVAPLGLRWRSDYHWVGTSSEGIRQVLRYSVLRGRGTFAWGVCLDFVKVPSGGKLVYNSTERSAALHLFERAPAYVNTFRRGHIADAEGYGVVCHTRGRAEHTVTRSIAHLLGTIEATFERMGSLDGVIREAERQAAAVAPEQSFYWMHLPPPAYVLAFCYAHEGRLDDAMAMLARLRDPEDASRLDLVEAHLRKSAGAGRL